MKTVQDAKLSTPTERLRLSAGARHWRKLVAGVDLGYRRGNAGAGRWLLRRYVGKARYDIKSLHVSADDLAPADGKNVLSFSQVTERLLDENKRRQRQTKGKMTVAMALDGYRADLQTRNGDPGNVTRLRYHVPDDWLQKEIASLSGVELRQWRKGLAKALTPSSVNRVMSVLRAALNNAAADIGLSDRPWINELLAIEGATQARNVILTDAQVRAVVEEAYLPRWDAARIKSEEARRAALTEAEKWAAAFGLLVEVLATTGARYSQVARLECQDLQNGDAPRLLMPSSRKGKGVKKINRRPLPIPAALALKLKVAAGNRPARAPLLTKPTLEPWAKSDHSRPFQSVVDSLRDKAADASIWADVTCYALRHSSIVRQLLASVPVRVVAVNHDTSVQMIEQHYSAYISDHSDAISRATLIDLSVPRDNVMAIKR